MIHFFPELAALYHRSLIVSLEPIGEQNFYDEWIQELSSMSPDKKSFIHLNPNEHSGSTLNGFFSGSLGKRNRDTQKIMGFSTSLGTLKKNPQLLDATDSLFVEINAESIATDEIYRWDVGPEFLSKKVVWCLKTPFSAQPKLHEKALDKKLVELSPESLRILWPKSHFIRDALEWVLSF